MDQADAGSMGIFSRRTNQTQEAWGYSHDGPIRRTAPAGAGSTTASRSGSCPGPAPPGSPVATFGHVRTAAATPGTTAAPPSAAAPSPTFGHAPPRRSGPRRGTPSWWPPPGGPRDRPRARRGGPWGPRGGPRDRPVGQRGGLRGPRGGSRGPDLCDGCGRACAGSARALHITTRVPPRRGGCGARRAGGPGGSTSRTSLRTLRRTAPPPPPPWRGLRRGARGGQIELGRGSRGDREGFAPCSSRLENTGGW
eukprot:3299212-Pyramimonas_sp.AAC.1